MAKNKMMRSNSVLNPLGLDRAQLTYLAVVLLFLWVPVYGIVSGVGIVAEAAYLVTDPQGFATLMIYLSPLVANCYAGRGKILNYLYFLPLVWTVYDTAIAVPDYSPFITYWLMTLVNFYASLILTKLGEEV